MPCTRTPVPTIAPTPTSGARMAALTALMLSVALTACGGGGGSDDDTAPGPAPAPAPIPAPPTAPPLAAGTSALAGDWVSTKLCVPIGGGRSAYQMVRIVEQSATVVALQSGTFIYASTNCQGAGSALVSPVGTVTFSRIESDATVAAHWGAWRTITGTTSYVAWAKPNDNKLCLLGDQNPSVLPTLDSVAKGAAILISRMGVTGRCRPTWEPCCHARRIGEPGAASRSARVSAICSGKRSLGISVYALDSRDSI